MGINKVETSVCLRLKKKQQKQQMQDALLDAELISINVLHQLSLNLLGFCVLLCSLHLILHHLISFSPQLKQEQICSPRTATHSGSGCHFYRQFQKSSNGRTSFGGHFPFSCRSKSFWTVFAYLDPLRLIWRLRIHEVLVVLVIGWRRCEVERFMVTILELVKQAVRCRHHYRVNLMYHS